MEEVGGEASVEALAGVGREAMLHFAVAGAAVALGVACDQLVEELAVVCRDVLDVALTLEAPLDLEGGGTRIQQRLQLGRAVEVTRREEVLVLAYLSSRGVDQLVGQTALLGALSTVGRAVPGSPHGCVVSALH